MHQVDHEFHILQQHEQNTLYNFIEYHRLGSLGTESPDQTDWRHLTTGSAYLCNTVYVDGCSRDLSTFRQRQHIDVPRYGMRLMVDYDRRERVVVINLAGVSYPCPGLQDGRWCSINDLAAGHFQPSASTHASSTWSTVVRVTQ